jgi:hypothetical protein
MGIAIFAIIVITRGLGTSFYKFKIQFISPALVLVPLVPVPPNGYRYTVDINL